MWDDGLMTTARLVSGQLAPKFTVATAQGNVSLDSLLDSAASGVVVYFYPKASTPGCTKEACDFRDSLSSLRAAGYNVIGISPDPLSALDKFTANQDLNFPLGSDPDHSVMLQYGVWGEKKNYGRTFEGVIRSTFVINPDGTIKLALYNVKATGHVARLRKDLGLD